jgi:triphosphoribosyl-dephospho-CoA synthase
MSAQQKARDIARSLQLAITLEVSVPKPGNVSFDKCFESTNVTHFLASAIAAGPSFEAAAYRGAAAADCKLELDKLGVGELIKSAMSDVMAWQRGGNTILGTVMLFVPLAAAAGMTNACGALDLDTLRKNLNAVIKSTSALDSVRLYEAIDIALPSGLGDSPSLDLKDPKSKQRLLKNNVTLFEVFEISASYDDVSYEWINNYTITFDSTYPCLAEQLKTKPFEVAVVNTFLKILSERPDTFIARKMGKQKALEVQAEAQGIVELGGAETEAGKLALYQFDLGLRKKGNSANPGTTADLTAAAIALCTLGGYRP